MRLMVLLLMVGEKTSDREGHSRLPRTTRRALRLVGLPRESYLVLRSILVWMI